MAVRHTPISHISCAAQTPKRPDVPLLAYHHSFLLFQMAALWGGAVAQCATACQRRRRGPELENIFSTNQLLTPLVSILSLTGLGGSGWMSAIISDIKWQNPAFADGCRSQHSLPVVDQSGQRHTDWRFNLKPFLNQTGRAVDIFWPFRCPWLRNNISANTLLCRVSFTWPPWMWAWQRQRQTSRYKLSALGLKCRISAGPVFIGKSFS